MSGLNLSKVAFGCPSIDVLRQRQRSRVSDGEVPVSTRFRPKRADELVGGSLYWIIRHQLIARQSILGFADAEAGHRTIIRLDARLIPVRAWPRRAHQGWRYLVAADAPPDFGSGAESLDELPEELLSELAALALV